MVAMMLRGIGFEVVDLGINVASEEFVKQVKEQSPDILGLSALLTTTMPEMKKVIQGLEKGGLRKTVKIMVGGRRLINASRRRSVPTDTATTRPRRWTWRRVLWQPGDGK
jgi:methylmalonyl-CoA mutase cobalamin-binding domain/chain